LISSRSIVAGAGHSWIDDQGTLLRHQHKAAMHGQARPCGMAIKVSLDLLETARSIGARSGSKVRKQLPICVLRTVYEDAVIRREGVCVRKY